MNCDLAIQCFLHWISYIDPIPAVIQISPSQVLFTNLYKCCNRCHMSDWGFGHVTVFQYFSVVILYKIMHMKVCKYHMYYTVLGFRVSVSSSFTCVLGIQSRSIEQEGHILKFILYFKFITSTIGSFFTACFIIPFLFHMEIHEKPESFHPFYSNVIYVQHILHTDSHFSNFRTNPWAKAMIFQFLQ